MRSTRHRHGVIAIPITLLLFNFAMLLGAPSIAAASLTGLHLSGPEAIAISGSHVWVTDGPQTITVSGPRVWIVSFNGETITELYANSGTLVRVITIQDSK